MYPNRPQGRRITRRWCKPSRRHNSGGRSWVTTQHDPRQRSSQRAPIATQWQPPRRGSGTSPTGAGAPPRQTDCTRRRSSPARFPGRLSPQKQAPPALRNGHRRQRHKTTGSPQRPQRPAGQLHNGPPPLIGAQRAPIVGKSRCVQAVACPIGKHCSLPGFALLNRGPTLTTPPQPKNRR